VYLSAIFAMLASAGCTLGPPPTVEAIACAPGLQEIRVGVEFVAFDTTAATEAAATRTALLPAHDSGQDPKPAPRRTVDETRPLPDPEPHVPVERGSFMRPLTKKQIAALPTAAERATFRMLQTLVGQDGGRLPRELGWSYLQRRLGETDPFARDPWHEDEDAARDAALQELGPRLVAKPFRNALRELPLVRDVEIWIQDFKVRNVPTSGAWLDSRDEDRRRYGHVSLRLQGDSGDPLAVTYSLHGWRLGFSRDMVRAGFSTPLGGGWWLALGTTFDHAADTFDALAEIKLDIDARTRLLFVFGNQLNLFPGPTIDRMAHEEFDGGTGAMMYVETLF